MRCFNARLRDELLDGEIFYTLREAQIVIEINTIRPHASLVIQVPALPSRQAVTAGAPSRFCAPGVPPHPVGGRK
jgi:hypothetical protein